MSPEFEAQLQEYVVGPYITLREQYSHYQRNFTKDKITTTTELLLGLCGEVGFLGGLKDVPAYSDKVRATASWLLMVIRDKAENRTVPDINTPRQVFRAFGMSQHGKGKGSLLDCV